MQEIYVPDDVHERAYHLVLKDQHEAAGQLLANAGIQNVERYLQGLDARAFRNQMFRNDAVVTEALKNLGLE